MSFRFETLDIWEQAKNYASKVYLATAKFPRHEDYGLKSQMNRAVNSICLNIAEGSVKTSKKAFDYQLEVALGSTIEVVAASCLALEQGYVADHEHKALYDQGQKLAKSINAFRKAL